MIAAALGLLQRRNWAWWFAVVLFGIHVVADVVGFIITRDWLKSARSILIPAAVLYVLTRPPVRRYFRQERQ